MGLVSAYTIKGVSVLPATSVAFGASVSVSFDLWTPGYDLALFQARVTWPAGAGASDTFTFSARNIVDGVVDTGQADYVTAAVAGVSNGTVAETIVIEGWPSAHLTVTNNSGSRACSVVIIADCRSLLVPSDPTGRDHMATI